MLSTSSRVTGSVWIGEEVEGAACRVEVERSDTDEVAVHIRLGGDADAYVSLYLPDDQALRLLPLLGWAVVDE